LEGILGYIYHVKSTPERKRIGNKTNKPSDKSLIGNKTDRPKGLLKLYREFLFYKYFFSLKRPLIACEGKTDSVYLKCALLQLEKDFGELIERKGEKINFKIGFLKRTKTLEDVWAMPGGTSGLKQILDVYKEYMALFHGDGKKHPVIMLIDNDSGAKQIKEKLHVKDLSSPFYYYGENVYVVPIPIDREGKEKMIEDLFDKKILEIQIDGKTFNPDPKFDKTKEYSKTVFASKVVKAHQKEINFDGFKEVLNRFQMVIEDYKKKI